MPQTEIAKKTLLGIVPIDSPFYRFHPVTRMTLLVFLSVTPMFIDLPEVNLGFIAVCIGLLAWGRVRLEQIKRYLPLLATVALFMFTVAFLAPGDRSSLTPFRLLGLTFYVEPVWWALVSYIRLIAMLFGAILYFSTNRERDLLVALRSLRVPFPVSYVLALSLRAASMFMEDFVIIRQAERARGLDPDSLSLLDKVKLYTMYAVPLFAVALRRSSDISSGLFAKGYTLSGRPATGGKRGDFLRKQYRMTLADWIANWAMVISFVGVVILRVAFGAFSEKYSILKPLFLLMVGR